MSSEEGPFGIVRRRFLQIGVGGIWLVTGRLRQAEAAVTDPAGGWSGPPGKARYRIEGLAKVRGQKIYARDFRSKDMGWGEAEAFAMVLRATVVGRPWTAIQLGMLPDDLRPVKVVTAAELVKDKIALPDSDDTSSQSFAPGSLFVAKNTAAEFYGQPVAILIFKSYRIYREANRILQFNPDVIQFGSAPPVGSITSMYRATPTVIPLETFKATAGSKRFQRAAMPPPGSGGPADAPFYLPPTYVTRYKNQFSQTLQGATNPYQPGSSPANQQAADFRQKIAEEMKTEWHVVEGHYETQQIDPMFMEPESGLAWFESDKQTLHMVVGTQSTEGCLQDAATMFAAGSAFPVKTMVLNACYPGGGFGGRDVSTFPTLLSLAAVYSAGPVRMAYNRFEQFQSGLKQLGSEVEQKLAIDSTGKFQALVAKYRMKAGGRNNYSQWIAQLAGYCGGGSYVIPRVAIDATAEASSGVIAGSMRGFGGPQAAFAVESLIDEAARQLKRDPIQLREQNAIAQGQETVTGYQIAHSCRVAEICRRARTHPLWIGRAAEHARRGPDAPVLYGVGFGMANQAFGTGADGVMAAVQFDSDGKLSVTSNAVDMGNGLATTLAISTAALGTNAHRVQTGDPELFNSALQMVSGEPPAWTNPHYTPSVSMSSSACITAFHQVHAVEQACRILMETAVWPAARVLWKLPATASTKAVHPVWEGASLTAKGLPRLASKDIVAAMFRSGGVTGAVVHACYQGEWLTSDFLLDGGTWSGPIDALAVQRGNPNWSFVARTKINQPPPNAHNFGRSLYSPSGTLAAVEVHRDTGTVRVLAVHTILEAGRVLQPDLLAGQSQGAVAMGIGYVLLEDLPPTTGGAGDGTWNLNRYQVARWRDVPLRNVTLDLLPPVTPDEPARGIAEAVLCPVLPAIAAAVTHATGRRFHSLPITPDRVKEALSRASD